MNIGELRVKYSKKWEDYALLDSGLGEKIERFGSYILKRPEPQAIWHMTANKKWAFDAIYKRSNEGGGSWDLRNKNIDTWVISYPSLAGKLSFKLSLMGFKHTGIFPEQAINWDFMQEKIMQAKKRGKKDIRILNLFAYTGGATLACSKAGADEVVHVDASKKIITTAKENAFISGLEKSYIRYIQDDVLKFIAREKRRGSFYDGIIMDPPAYGRGPSGELWQLESSIFSLIEEASSLLKKDALFFVLSAYANNLSPQSLKNVMNLTSLGGRKGLIEAFEIGLPFLNKNLILPCGYTVRWHDGLEKQEEELDD